MQTSTSEKSLSRTPLSGVRLKTQDRCVDMSTAGTDNEMPRLSNTSATVMSLNTSVKAGSESLVSRSYEPSSPERAVGNAPIPGDAMRKYRRPVLSVKIHDTIERTTDRHGTRNDRARARSANQVDPAPQVQRPMTGAFGVLRQQTVEKGRGVDAAHTRWPLIDRVANRLARRFAPSLHIEITQDLVVSMIRQDLLDADEADRIKHEWATRHRFTLKLDSFQSLLP